MSTYFRQTMPRNRGPKLSLIETLIAAAIICLLIGLLLSPFVKITGIPYEFSDGDRTGVVTKLSHKGLIWKTWEGQMNLGSMSTDGNGIMVPTIWYFSVKDPAIVRQIQAAAEGGKRITLHYSQPLVMGLKDGSSGYLITSTDSK